MSAELERAAEWIVGLQPSDVPSDVRALAVAQRVDILAALVAGARTAAGEAVTRTFDRTAESGPIATLPDGRRRPLYDALALHGMLPNALELDDFVFAGHTGQAAVGVPMALGQLLGSTGEQALLAQIAANEVAGRLGAVMTAGPQHGHMKAYLHRAAATTAAAKLLGLDVATTARALAIALSAPEYPLFNAAFSAETKILCTGEPLAAGVRAAYLAADGLDAALDVVEHPVGLVTSLSNHPSAPPVWDRLGATWSLQAICYKPVAACAYAAAAACAVARLVAAEGPRWDAEAVERVDVDTTVLTLTMEGFSKPHREALLTPVNTNFSTARTVALALLVGAPAGEHFTADRFAALSPRIAALASRVRLHHHWPYTIGMLRGVDGAIDHPGRPGIYGMGEAHATMARFAAAFGTPKAVSVGDVPALLALDRPDLAYLLRRYAVGLRAKLPFASEEARRAYVSRETDLRHMQLRFAARVRIHVGKRVLDAEITVPPGFAGDPDRLAVPRAKFLRETSDRADLLALLEREPLASPSEIAAAFAQAPPNRA